MQRSRLPEGGENLFQRIKAKTVEAEKEGRDIIRLSIGQPKGPALLSARTAAREAVMSEDESMHEYQDNGSPGVPDFAPIFVQAHVRRDLWDLPPQNLGFMPIPGIKAMLEYVLKACGAPRERIKVVTSTFPGYPTPADCARYLLLDPMEPPLTVSNQFRFGIDELGRPPDLIMVNYPHNPSGQIATREWWEQLCEYCSDHDVRLFNDAAYAALPHVDHACTLSEVALSYPDLSWMEAFSASKIIQNGTGWRVGAMVGSPDFIEDFGRIKGNHDSGFVAFAAAGVLNSVTSDWTSIEAVRATYEERIALLSEALSDCGLQLAVEPGAGFFTLWQTPKEAFGRRIEDAEDFNFAMIENTGIVGVHFGNFIRYAVCGDVKADLDKIHDAFTKARVNY